MIHPLFPQVPGRAVRVLLLGAHSDDIEIGMGATLLRLVESGADLEVFWAVATAEGARETEARASAADFAGSRLAGISIGNLRESYLPFVGAATKDFVHSLRDIARPDIVFSHARHDLHQDHRILAEIVPSAFRDQLILEFEIPKFDGDLATPGVYFEVSEAHIKRKVELLTKHFPSQSDKYWFDEALFLGLARIRGVESRSSTGYAEGFYCRKLVF